MRGNIQVQVALFLIERHFKAIVVFDDGYVHEVNLVREFADIPDELKIWVIEAFFECDPFLFVSNCVFKEPYTNNVLNESFIDEEPCLKLGQKLSLADGVE